jgi:TfoX/Sxy family transcriptional regulator of competence genes
MQSKKVEDTEVSKEFLNSYNRIVSILDEKAVNGNLLYLKAVSQLFESMHAFVCEPIQVTTRQILSSMKQLWISIKILNDFLNFIQKDLTAYDMKTAELQLKVYRETIKKAIPEKFHVQESKTFNAHIRREDRNFMLQRWNLQSLYFEAKLNHAKKKRRTK